MGSSCTRQQGAVALLFSILLIVILGFIGLAFDLGRLYNRKVELQLVADTAALAAARSLNGTAAGIDAALASAAAAATRNLFRYDTVLVEWRNDAIEFSAAPDGGWVDANSARSAPRELVYVRVNTAGLDPDMAEVGTIFMRLLAPGVTSHSVTAQTVAGRSTIKVLPLAVCAMSATPATARAGGELVQYGFRRGVSYDLMDINPHGSTGASFVINPIDPPGAAGMGSNTEPAVVGPFVCAGTMPMTAVEGRTLPLERPFPFAGLYRQLNSRFDQYEGAQCNFRDAPPDDNIKAYAYDSRQTWMVETASSQGAARLDEASPARRHTIADPAVPPAATTAPMYGPLWAIAPPVPFSAYTPGVEEPKEGYPPFDRALWPTLYAGAPTAKHIYPGNGHLLFQGTTPYRSSSAPYHSFPNRSHGRGVGNRRILNVPLLACPVAGVGSSTGTILAIGRFLMTVPATPSTLFAEFAGIAAEHRLTGPVEIYR